jgi:predicted nucleic acid-binding protein
VKRVVVDANVLVACLVADGRTREVFLRSGEIRFIVPDVIFEEVGRDLPEIAAKAHVALETSRALSRELSRNLQPVPQALWASALPRAKEMARAAHTPGDEPYIALAMVQLAPVWSFDKALGRVPGIRIVSTSEVEALAWGG